MIQHQKPQTLKRGLHRVRGRGARSRARRRDYLRPGLEQLEERNLLIGWGPDQLIVAGLSNVGVYEEQDDVFQFLGNIQTGLAARAIDFTPDGDLAVVAPEKVVVFNDQGEQIGGFEDARIGSFPDDIDVDANGDIFIATNSTSGVVQFSPTGDFVRSFGNLPY